MSHGAGTAGARGPAGLAGPAPARGRDGGDGGDGGDPHRTGGYRLRVNPIACEAHGMCAELLPEMITTDPWGYPIVARADVPGELLPLARRAVTACPTLALILGHEG